MSYMMADKPVEQTELTDDIEVAQPAAETQTSLIDQESLIANSFARRPSRRELWILYITGAAAGAAIWPVKIAVKAWVLTPLFCRTPDMATVCNNSEAAAFVVSLVVVGLFAASALALLRVPRPIMITAPAMIAISGLAIYLAPLGNLAAILWCIGLMFAAFNLFYTVSKVSRRILSVSLSVALTVLLFAAICLI